MGISLVGPNATKPSLNPSQQRSFQGADNYPLLTDGPPQEPETHLPEAKTTRPLLERPRYYRCKRLLDLFVALLALGLLCPLITIIALVVRLDAAGPIFAADIRVGVRRRRQQGRFCWEQRRFRLYKFRITSFPVPGNGPAVTRIGRFLRQSHLDELPQLWNVVKGDLSLVGPRPGRPAEVHGYTAWQRRRLETVQGMTGLWQLIDNGEARTDAQRAAAFTQMMQLDIQYVDTQSFWLDIKILMNTLMAVFRA
ncbi:MAG: sugar transferase [Caldilineaceae bacterium]|nr:sugar transferase [Caldilineaceae bacterium]